MSSSIRDKVYLPIVAVQLVGTLVLDLLPLYPPSLWQSPSSPLHSLLSLRTWWASYSGDPYFASLTPEPWLEGFLYVEALVQFPLTAYLVWKFSQGLGLGLGQRRTSGPTELAGLAYGCVTFMGALACCCDLWHMGPERVRGDCWGRLFWGTYLPFCVVPAVMAVDMFLRLLPRVQSTESTALRATK
ncbi:hypothetical protein E4U11_008043 [Claviceps purpurea]|nr:hypothetical protein E4U11_008043 [Claviceps purpurea]